MSLPVQQQPRLYRGRTYLETLVLTLTAEEMRNPDLYTAVARRLEEEVCALAIAIPFLIKVYHDAALKAWRQIRRLESIPEPELKAGTCTIYDDIYEHIKRHARALLGRRYTRGQDERLASGLAARIVRVASLAALYRAAVLSY